MKERLTGAIILVVLIVLLVPELLSGPKGPPTTAPAPNSSEEPPLRSYTINLGDDSHPRTESAETSGPAMPQPSGPEQPSLPQSNAAPADVPDPAQAQAPAGDSPEPGSQATGPQTAGGPDETVNAHSSEAVVPPTPTRSPPESHAPSTAAPAPKVAPPTQKAIRPKSSESGWGVQLGVFASRENAERLALEVRAKGFKASVSAVTSASRKLYRVRVGPTPDRAAALELQGRLKAAGRPGGTVVPIL